MILQAAGWIADRMRKLSAPGPGDSLEFPDDGGDAIESVEFFENIA